MLSPYKGHYSVKISSLKYNRNSVYGFCNEDGYQEMYYIKQLFRFGKIRFHLIQNIKMSLQVHSDGRIYKGHEIKYEAVQLFRKHGYDIRYHYFDGETRIAIMYQGDRQLEDWPDAILRKIDK